MEIKIDKSNVATLIKLRLVVAQDQDYKTLTKIFKW